MFDKLILKSSDVQESNLSVTDIAELMKPIDITQKVDLATIEYAKLINELFHSDHQRRKPAFLKIFTQKPSHKGPLVLKYLRAHHPTARRAK